MKNTISDRHLDKQLRPNSLLEFSGNASLLHRLNIMIAAAKERGDPLSHLLLYGPPGLGKTTLATIIAKEMESNLFTTSGPIIEKAGDLAGILTNLNHNSTLFIDEIHRLPKNVEEYLYSAMDNSSIDIIIDADKNAKTVVIPLNRFTLIGATTKAGNVSAPLRSRFSTPLRMEYYTEDELSNIIIRSAKLLHVVTHQESAQEIAKRSRGTPRVANNILHWIRDFAQMHNQNIIDIKTVHQACHMIAIDTHGLDEMDKKILHTIIQHYSGGPVGLKAIAANLCEEENTIEDVHEPYLLMKGFLRRTPRGREATPLAYRYFNTLNT